MKFNILIDLHKSMFLSKNIMNEFIRFFLLQAVIFHIKMFNTHLGFTSSKTFLNKVDTKAYNEVDSLNIAQHLKEDFNDCTKLAVKMMSKYFFRL